MPNTLVSIDLALPPEEQAQRPHNRWHPEIPPLATVAPGEVFRVQCMDPTGGQIVNNDSAADVEGLDLCQVLYLSGPVAVEGARPGDVIAIDILDIGTLPGAEWGYTVILDHSAGIGLFKDDCAEARKAIWDLDGIFAMSRHIGGVRFAGSPHPGILGCAPSEDLLARWHRRERAIPRDPLIRGLEERGAPGALLGDVPASAVDRIAADAARTWAERENGGSSDVKALTRGSRVFLPVFISGANISVGDLQFSQGDGKITGFGGIKMAGWIDLCAELIPGGMEKLRIHEPVYQPGSAAPSFCDSVTFRGFPVEEEGLKHFLDLRTAYAHACRTAIDYLGRFGYSTEQAYMLLTAAPVEGRINAMFDPPSACCTVSIPTQVFDFPITAERPKRVHQARGELARP
jgi:formamidase